MIMINKQKMSLLFFSITFLLLGLMGFYDYSIRGCVQGRWGSFSCGPKSLLLPVILSISGLWLLILSIKHKSDNDKELLKEDMTIICPKCEIPKTVDVDKIQNQKCSECDVSMVPLEGFYDKK